MKAYFTLLFALTLAAAQGQHRWNYGLGGHYATEHYSQTVRSYQADPSAADRERIVASFAMGTGIWVERRIGMMLGLLSQLDYHVVSVNRAFLNPFIIKVGGGKPYSEWHNSIALSIAGRLYAPSKSKFKFHLDAGLKVDRIIRYRQRYAVFDFKEWNPIFLNANVPAWSAAVGLQHGRVGLSVGYQNYWMAKFDKKILNSDRQMLAIRNFSRQNVTMHVNVRLNK
jgi:hypothetical protein